MRTFAAAVLASALLTTSGCMQSRAALPAQADQSALRSAHDAALRYGTYAWSIEDVVRRYNAGTLWALLNAKHVNVVLAGFDDAYIKKCSTAPGAATMNAMIAKAQRHGVRVVLLLGDPSWIPPSGVSSLEQILHDLRRVNFAGLDLDLEPNELTGVPVVKAFKELVSSMHAYEGASEWPVSIDVNHIYVDDAAVKKYSYCLMCGLESAGVKRVNLMTYVSDPKTVAADVGPILAKYPVGGVHDFAERRTPERASRLGLILERRFRAVLQGYAAARCGARAARQLCGHHDRIVVLPRTHQTIDKEL